MNKKSKIVILPLLSVLSFSVMMVFFAIWTIPVHANQVPWKYECRDTCSFYTETKPYGIAYFAFENRYIVLSMSIDPNKVKPGDRLDVQLDGEQWYKPKVYCTTGCYISVILNPKNFVPLSVAKELSVSIEKETYTFDIKGTAKAAADLILKVE